MNQATRQCAAYPYLTFCPLVDQTSKTRMCARLEIRTGRLAHTRMYVASRRARAVRAKCSLAGLTIRSFASFTREHRKEHRGSARDGPCAYGKACAYPTCCPLVCFCLREGPCTHAHAVTRRPQREPGCIGPGLCRPDVDRVTLTGDARPRFFESSNNYALLEEQVRRARSDDGRL